MSAAPAGWTRTPFGCVPVVVRIEMGWLYDDGADTHDATLSGDVSSLGLVEGVRLIVDSTGDEADLTPAQLAEAKDDLRTTAYAMWGVK